MRELWCGPMKSYGFDTFLRVNAGTAEENSAFVTALKKVLRKKV